MIAIIAAVARNRVIGCNGRIPWDLPADTPDPESDSCTDQTFMPKQYGSYVDDNNAAEEILDSGSFTFSAPDERE